MSEPDFPLERNCSISLPADSDDQFLAQIAYEAPLAKASAWLRKRLIDIIRSITPLIPSYASGHIREDRLISKILDESDERCRMRFRYYCNMLLQYRQGQAPRKILHDDLRILKILLNRIKSCIKDRETIRLISTLLLDFKSLINGDLGIQLQDSYIAEIKTMFERLLTLLGRLTDRIRAEEDEILGLSSPTATKDDLRTEANRVISKTTTAIKKATSEPIKGCHHRNKAKDKIVQQVIQYLSKPGVTFSIHNACEKLFGPKHRSEKPWLYDWCHRNAVDIQSAVEALRALQNPK